jgi:hypothetical protein
VPAEPSEIGACDTSGFVTDGGADVVAAAAARSAAISLKCSRRRICCRTWSPGVVFGTETPPRAGGCGTGGRDVVAAGEHETAAIRATTIPTARIEDRA